jgi:nucleotide-binding universal stress UspA family protein
MPGSSAKSPENGPHFGTKADWRSLASDSDCPTDEGISEVRSGFWSDFNRNHQKIHPDEAKSPGASTPRLNVLVPFNFTMASCTALDCALRMAQDQKATVTLLHAINLNLSPYGPANPALIKQEMRRVAREGISQLAALARKKNLSVNYAIRDGNPSGVIKRFITENAVDLVIIGEHQPRRFGWFSGRTLAERVVGKAQCPVLVVPAND